ncbi:hypothetical protein DXG01_007247 [Tephrocybe rancida]|nr:hypothetical protein DXG01_007247 [Tephrocybe rancida]
MEDAEDKAPKAKKPRLLAALPTYSGCGRSTVYKWNKKMREAAVGCKTLDGFLTSQQSIPVNLRINDGLDQAQEPLAEAEDKDNSDICILPTYEEWWGWIRNSQTNHDDEPTNGSAVEVTGATGTPVASAEWITSEDLLDIRDEEPEESQRPAISVVVQKMIAAAKRHKSFPALFKLQAIQKYLELVLKYSCNPNVKNP